MARREILKAQTMTDLVVDPDISLRPYNSSLARRLFRVLDANREYLGDRVRFAEGVRLAEQDLLFDPQTSGGLLIACPPDRADEVVKLASERLSTPCAVVGRVLDAQRRPSLVVSHADVSQST